MYTLLTLSWEGGKVIFDKFSARVSLSIIKYVKQIHQRIGDTWWNNYEKNKQQHQIIWYLITFKLILTPHVFLYRVIFSIYLYLNYKNYSQSLASHTSLLGIIFASSHISNHLSLVFILSITEVTLTLFRITSFLILSFLICLHINLGILIFATFIFWICEFLTDERFSSYNKLVWPLLDKTYL